MSEAEDDQPAQVARDCVVSFHYELFDAGGEALESSRRREPVLILHGHGNVLPGVEAALLGRSPGERFEVTLAPGEAYGERREDARRRVSKKHLAGNTKRLAPGMQAGLRTAEGLRPVTVVKVGSSVVDVDLNHPLAGRSLRFDIEVVALRAASPEELAHGHVHGPGGHHH